MTVEEETTLQKLPKTFRIFLTLEEEAKKEKGTSVSDPIPEAAGGDPDEQ